VAGIIHKICGKAVEKSLVSRVNFQPVLKLRRIAQEFVTDLKHDFSTT
jgi:hypothetical protein